MFRSVCASVFNGAARLVLSTRRLEHVTPLLRDHWLKLAERIQSHLCVPAYRFTASPHHTWLKHFTCQLINCRITSSPPFQINIDTTCADKLHLMIKHFTVAAARAWNALPASAKTVESYIAFRRQKNAAVSSIFQR